MKGFWKFTFDYLYVRMVVLSVWLHMARIISDGKLVMILKRADTVCLCGTCISYTASVMVKLQLHRNNISFGVQIRDVQSWHQPTFASTAGDAMCRMKRKCQMVQMLADRLAFLNWNASRLLPNCSLMYNAWGKYVQGLQPRDYKVRLQFSQCLLQNILVEPHILYSVLRTDEAPCTRTGVITSTAYMNGHWGAVCYWQLFISDQNRRRRINLTIFYSESAQRYPLPWFSLKNNSVFIWSCSPVCSQERMVSVRMRLSELFTPSA